jgi:hypothetical protein
VPSRRCAFIPCLYSIRPLLSQHVLKLSLLPPKINHPPQCVDHLEVVRQACRELQGCASFSKLLQAVLELGNHLNQVGGAACRLGEGAKRVSLPVQYVVLPACCLPCACGPTLGLAAPVSLQNWCVHGESCDMYTNRL